MQSALKITSRDFDLPHWLESEISEKNARPERTAKYAQYERGKPSRCSAT